MADLPKIDSEGLRMAKKIGSDRVSSAARVSLGWAGETMGDDRELIVETIAKAIREAERKEGHCDDGDTYRSYLPAAQAAIDAYHDYIRRHA
ncbi:hypothetical protein JQ633_31980 [Bradyrhizobium tropiciagri]|uniref:hypothetical protein n=1 Tax=Bradyrhizobium tropiciagri TaxID=312253 RepID=UPI001BA6645C|nr:hypothetical protein [Bradyrhizobium tropiciagri]MBR0875016.1 hypothetical protein [Bradyrhizobium tropiciagri]